VSKPTERGGFLRAPPVEDEAGELPTAKIVPPSVAAPLLGSATVLDALEKRCPKCGRGYPRVAEVCAADGEALIDAKRVPGDPFVGAMIRERYAIEGILGSGGMGTVYEVIHVGLEKRFAMKILRPDIAYDKTTVERFIQEARVAASLKHPNLADVSDFGEIAPDDVPAVLGKRVPFFVMEMLRGETLGDVLRERKRIEATFGANIMKQIALGLGAAHELGIIHRDLKPDNVFLVEGKAQTTRGSAKKPPRAVKLLDFGIAKVVSGTGKLTRPNMVFGTPAYMSPEQAAGDPLDPRTDLYSLGIVMYEALTGQVPFVADLEMSVATKHQFEAPEPIERVAPGDERLAALAPIVMRCLEKDREARFASAGDVVLALEGRAVRARRARRLELRREETATVTKDPPRPRGSGEAAPRPETPSGGWRVPLVVFAVGSFLVVTFVAYLRGAGPFAGREASERPEPSSRATVGTSAPSVATAPPPPAATPSTAETGRTDPARASKSGVDVPTPRPAQSTAGTSRVIQTW
jgi:serine/threonine protein kinase